VLVVGIVMIVPIVMVAKIVEIAKIVRIVMIWTTKLVGTIINRHNKNINVCLSNHTDRH